MPKLIVIEGLDGSGKSTQMQLLSAWLREAGLTARQIKLPDYEHPSSTLVKMYLAGEFGQQPGDVNAFAASAFYAVDRYANFHQFWKEDYEKGTLILADRYATSNAVHQMVKLPKVQWEDYLFWMEDFEYTRMRLPKPDLVLYLDMPVEVSQMLMSRRYDGDEKKKDVHESNRNYLTQCRETAAYAAEKCGWQVIPCAKDGLPLPREEIHKRVVSLVKKELERTV